MRAIELVCINYISMPSAPKIRKQVLAVLEQYTLPALSAERLTQIFRAPRSSQIS